MVKKIVVLGTMILLSAVVTEVFVLAETLANKKSAAPPKAAVERTRETAKMLDHIYKSAIVLITDKYVEDENDYPAGSAFVELFKSVDKKGWHKVRLIDLTGEPYESENVAADAFEKEGGKQLLAGKAHVEKIIEKEGKPYLRVMTPVPVVMKKCVMCHPHYADVKQGTPIGAMTYVLPIR